MGSLPFFIRATAFFTLFFGLLLIEQIAPYAPTAQKKSFRVIFHLGLNITNSVILYLVMTWPTVGALVYSQHHALSIASLLGLGGWTEIVATVILLDIWDYWMHRAFHKVPFMWRFHRAHHSDMELDVTTAARFHIGELILSGCSKCLMILFWGPSLWGLVAFDLLLNSASLFHHSNVAIPMRFQDRLERLIVTPRMHRCHHALYRACFNTNFSTILSFWDRIFASYRWSRDKAELEVMGLSGPRGDVTMKIKPFLLTPL
ncbi:MAG TPA: sterol desaturase family protein [Syntrophorhabdales bacterium]|nr:sterol desaturase family protein [Syntrophorhabdales bacterium]